MFNVNTCQNLQEQKAIKHTLKPIYQTQQDSYFDGSVLHGTCYMQFTYYSINKKKQINARGRGLKIKKKANLDKYF